MLLASIESLLLDGSINDYGYIKNSNHTISGVDDAEEWKLLLVRYILFLHKKHLL